MSLVSGTFFASANSIPKKINARSNPPAYAAFSRPLEASERERHALNRLTFGPRPGDAANLERLGLARWLDDQLHPERIVEDPALAVALAPLQTLTMGIRDTYLNYPSPQLIAAVARGRQDLPDDPPLRQVVSRLAQRYLARNDSSQEGVEPKLHLADLLPPDQILLLRTGKPDERRAVLDSIPPEKRFDFAWALTPDDRKQLLPFAPTALRRELMRAGQPQSVISADLTEGKLLRAIYSRRQLNELLVDIWFNHFNVTLNKGPERYAVPTYEREAIRPYVFGSFHDLLLQTAKSPAMLFYLDNWQSTAADAPVRPGKAARGLNENYGRELLELHTVSVDGGYTQADVIDVARCFTGWTIANPRKGGGFEFNERLHDNGRKVVLGHVMEPGAGMNDGLEVIKILVHHPSTAHFISLKLARRFVADDPPPSLVNRMSKVFLQTNGSLREVVRTMIESPEFWSQGAYQAKIKTPFEMVVSAVRASDADVTSVLPLANELQKLGQPLYRKTEPTGYSSANSAWVGSASLLERMNFSLAFAHNRLPGIHVDVAHRPSTLRANFNTLDFAANAGLFLGSPEFQHH